MIIDPRSKPGTSAHPVSFIDLFPTLIELTGTEEQVPNGLDGQSLADIVRGGSRGPTAAVSTYQKTHAVRTDRYRYIFSETEKTEELHDHATDPGEHTNIAYHDDMRAILTGMRTRLSDAAGVVTPIGLELPEIFGRLPGGTVRRKDFVPLKEVRYVIPDW